MYSAKLSETTAAGQTIFEFDPEGPGALGYRRLTARVVKDGPAAGFRAPLAAPGAVTPTPPAVNEERSGPSTSRRPQPLKERLERVEALTTAKGLPLL